MSNRNGLKINTIELIIYLIIVPFLYPRGFSEYSSSYKNFFTAWLYLAMFTIVILFITRIKKLKIKKCSYIVIIYFIYLIANTFLIRHTFSDALQKLFAAPALCMVSYILITRNPKLFVNSIANVLIIIFSLNLTIFSPLVFNKYFDAETSHMLFIGHVQVAAQLGLIGVFIGYLLISYNKIIKGNLLIILAFLTMIMSKTIASVFVLVFLFAGLIYIKISKKQFFLQIKTHIYLAITAIVNTVFLILLYIFKFKFSFLGKPTTFNGRTTIWQSAIALAIQNPLFGYGASGTKIQVYWSAWQANKGGMFYAHSEVLQELLDGGIVLLVLFGCVLISHIAYLNEIKSKKLLSFANLCVLTVLITMIFESPTEYHYIFLFLSILAYLPEIEGSFDALHTN